MPEPSEPAPARAAFRRGWAAGLFAAPVLILAVAAASVSFWPEWPMLRTFARILEHVVPQMALLALAGAAAMAWLGAPRGASALAALAGLAALGHTALQHLPRSAAPAAAPADLSVLWINLLQSNPTPPDRLARALIDSGADIVLVAEAAPLLPAADRLAAAFPVRAGCAAPERCTLMALARDGGASVTLHRLGRTGEARGAVVRLDGDPAVAVVALHLFKPWFYGIAESEIWDAMHALGSVRRGPLVVAGDFNAVPWSARLRTLSDRCALAFPRWPRPTWPARAGRFGLPIDHVLVRGARLVTLTRWGADLGSNHAGLLAEISLAGADPGAPKPELCRPEPRGGFPAPRPSAALL